MQDKKKESATSIRYINIFILHVYWYNGLETLFEQQFFMVLYAFFNHILCLNDASDFFKLSVFITVV